MGLAADRGIQSTLSRKLQCHRAMNRPVLCSINCAYAAAPDGSCAVVRNDLRWHDDYR